MNQIENLNKLKQKWQKERPEYDNFVSDGILDYQKFSTQSPKILFLLKEANDNFKNIVPLPPNKKKGYGPNGNSHTFWRNMRAYEAIIQSVWQNEKFDKKELLKIKEQPNINTAYVNFKKQCENKSTSNEKDLLKYVKQDKDFLNEQIELINPNVIYCAGTFLLYKKLDIPYEKLSSKIYISNNRIIIDYLHFSHRKGYDTFEELYDLLNVSAFHKKVEELMSAV